MHRSHLPQVNPYVSLRFVGDIIQPWREKSIYTLILLGYLGVLETPNLEPYIEIANKIKNYTEMYRDLLKSK